MTSIGIHQVDKIKIKVSNEVSDNGQEYKVISLALYQDKDSIYEIDRVDIFSKDMNIEIEGNINASN
jgi:hypothetical protein